MPVSTFLSGGLDSSIITVLAHQADAAIDAYTITFRPQDQRLEAMPDDAIYARKVAAKYGVNLHEIEISPDIVTMLPRIVDVLDEPIGDPAAINTLLMCEAARERGVKVMLSGMGADELFGGYRKQWACLLASRYGRLPAGLRHHLMQPAVERLPLRLGSRGLRYTRWAKRFMTFADLPEEPRFRRSYTLYDADELTALISPDLAVHVGEVIDEHTEIYNDNSLSDDMVNRMCLADTRMFLPGLNLAYTDRASMAASIEVRVPFVDPIVAAAAFSIDGHDKIRRGKSKIALKQAAANWLPPEIVHRPKASFSAPLRAWVKDDLHEIIQDVLVAGELVDCGYDPPRCADPAHRRRANGPAGPLQADLAVADARALVPPCPLDGRLGMIRPRGVRSSRPVLTRGLNEADSAELQVRRARPFSTCPPRLAARWRPRSVALLADLHRHRNDEGDRGQAVHDRQGPGAP